MYIACSNPLFSEGCAARAAALRILGQLCTLIKYAVRSPVWVGFFILIFLVRLIVMVILLIGLASFWGSSIRVYLLHKVMYVIGEVILCQSIVR